MIIVGFEKASGTRIQLYGTPKKILLCWDALRPQVYGQAPIMYSSFSSHDPRLCDTQVSVESSAI